MLAAEARAIGRGGIAVVAKASGAARSTIARGIRELGVRHPLEVGRVRRAGGGRKKLVATDATLMADLERLVEPMTRGDPMSPLRWTGTSLRVLAGELQKKGHRVSHMQVGRLLHEAGYSLQANKKTTEGTRHPDRDAQFHYINDSATKQLQAGQPVISVDGKKKELVGDFKNSGREWRPAGMPERVKVHDFIVPEDGKAIPYGVYDMTRNDGWVSVGVTHDTAAFAVRTIAKWWQKMGRDAYPRAKSLLVTADSGGSNGARSRLWKVELQRFADKTGLEIHVCHFPPGTSKWNKIEHRLFSHITMNWRGRPLTSLATIVSLIAATKTQQGLRIRCELDEGRYPSGQKVTDEQMAQVTLQPHAFHGDWNYTIKPRAVKG